MGIEVFLSVNRAFWDDDIFRVIVEIWRMNIVENIFVGKVIFCVA